MKEGKFMGATDECFEGLGIGFGMVIGLFAIIFIAAVIISPIFGYLAGGVCMSIMLLIFIIAIVYRLFFENFHRELKQRKKENAIRYNNEHKVGNESNAMYNSFSISQDDYSDQVEEYTEQKNGKKKRWK